jgi:tetratricopeptide (TPR) repeat protein
VTCAELHHALKRLEASGELDEQAASLFRPEPAEGSLSRGSLSDTASSNSLRATPGQAAELYRKGAYRQCSDLLVSQLPTGPAKDLELLARCSFATGDYKHAFDAAGKLSESAATGAEGLYWEIRSSQKLATEALAYASEIDSSSPKLHVLLGDTHRQQEHLDIAEEEYRKALALQPEDTGALFGLSLALLADGKTDQALHIAQAAIKDNPSDPELNAVMGEILCQRENFSDAEGYLKESLNSKPKYASHVHALLGKVYGNTNRLQEAIGELKLALPGDRDGHLYYQIGRLYLKIGDRDAAQKAFLVSKRLGREALNRTADLGQGQHDSDFR